MLKSVSLKDLIRMVLIVIALTLLYCGGGTPADHITGLRIKKCPASYLVDSKDSLKVDLRVKNGEGFDLKCWFIGVCTKPDTTARDTFISIATTIQTDPDSQDITLFWIPDTDTVYSLGTYYITAHMDKFESAESPKWSSSPPRECDLYSMAKPYKIIIWSGDRQKGRKNEALNDTLAFKLRARLVKAETGEGVNDKVLTFKTNKGYFKESNQGEYKAETGTIQDSAGIAEAVLVLTQPSIPKDSFDYIIKVSADSTINTETFYARCADDEENSGLPEPYTHRKKYYPDGPEVLGDNLADGTSEEKDPNVKDVLVEIDYDPDAVPGLEGELPQILIIAEYALEHGKILHDPKEYSSGIDVHIDPYWGQFSAPSYMDEEQCRKYLRDTRTYRNHIHCIIGRKGFAYGSAIGKMEFVNPYTTDYDYRVFHTGHFSSGAKAKDNLDSCGCVVFAEDIKTKCDKYGKDYAKVMGIIIAHEIAHCLQMGHTPPGNQEELKDFMDADCGRDEWFKNFNVLDYNHFDISTLQDARTPPYYPDWIFALTTRQKLGIETVCNNFFDGVEERMEFAQARSTNNCPNGINCLPRELVRVIFNAMQRVMPWSIRRTPGGKQLAIVNTFDDKIDIIWVSWGIEKEWKWYYNFIRCDTIGKILLDLRKLKSVRHLKRYTPYTDPYLYPHVPTVDYFMEENGNICLFYGYADSTMALDRKIGVIRLNPRGKVITDTVFHNLKCKSFFVTPGKKIWFHTMIGNVYYSNSDLSQIIFLYRKFSPEDSGHQLFTDLVSLNKDCVLVIEYYNSKNLYTIKLNPDGSVARKMKKYEIDKVTFGAYDNVDLPGFTQFYLDSNEIYLIISTFKNFYIVKFNNDGEVIYPKRGPKTEVLPISAKPKDVKRFIKVTKNTIYHFAIDKEGQLYYEKIERK